MTLFELSWNDFSIFSMYLVWCFTTLDFKNLVFGMTCQVCSILTHIIPISISFIRIIKQHFWMLIYGPDHLHSYNQIHCANILIELYNTFLILNCPRYSAVDKTIFIFPHQLSSVFFVGYKSGIMLIISNSKWSGGSKNVGNR